MPSDPQVTLAYAAILAFGLTAIIALAIATFFFLYLRDKSKSRYDVQQHRAEISEMRKSYEEQLKSLTLQLTATDQRWRDLNHLLISSQRFEALQSGDVSPNTFLESVGIRGRDLRVDPKLVLLLTPFSPSSNDSYQAVVEACRRIGLTCVRGDEEDAHGDILTHILRIMVRAQIVIADIGSRNPNVYYELGIAHALDKPTILISETISDIPFDVQSKRILVYRDIDELGGLLPEMLARALAALQKEKSKPVQNEIIKDRRPFLFREPGDGFGLMRAPNDYLCITASGEAIVLPQGPYIYLRVMPLYEQQIMSDVETFEIVQRYLRPMRAVRGGTWSLGRHETGSVAFWSASSPPKISSSAAELSRSKELWANDFYYLDPNKERAKKIGFPFIPTGAVEEVLVDTLTGFLQLAREHLNVAPPIRVEAGFVGISNFRLAVDPRFFESDFEGRILRSALKHEVTLNEWPVDPGGILMPLFENLYDFAGLKRPIPPTSTRRH